MTFNELIENKDMLKNLNDLGYTNPTAIQEKALPYALNKQDVLAKAKTGSGKTVAFGIPILLDVNVKEKYKTSSIVLAPTRELADQVAKELRKVAKFKNNIKILTLCGGTPMRGQIHSLDHGAHIVVGTPGRVLAHLQKGSLNLKYITSLVLDEADRMLDMGFFEDIEKILDLTPKERQTLLFSATFDDNILKLSKSIQNDRIEVQIEEEKSTIQERFFKFSEQGIENAILHYRPKSCIIFCNTKIKCKELEERLQSIGFDALTINSDLDQIDRDETLIEFAHKSCTFLIATDVASRGLDIPNVDLVINYDLPKSEEVYTHRIGRTGRMDKEGIAISFVKGYVEYIDTELEDTNALHVKDKTPYSADLTTLCIDGGKRDKIRAGDILGTLVKDIGLEAKHIGKITINRKDSYVSIEKEFAKEAFEKLKETKIKNKKIRVWMLA
ncbi:ATP-dependent RNA helicase DbpA [Sulfurospirillum arcachonense]|uniref:ATP-dependent RNA helicase DbpA n=1 Tax=Sulfurospirillum arcachonense TaxID=57666 RepID=UPI000468EBEE|nr:ATP-dependent RNA helicase DbpA [Sulfurospirillum arcachonense]